MSLQRLRLRFGLLNKLKPIEILFNGNKTRTQAKSQLTIHPQKSQNKKESKASTPNQKPLRFSRQTGTTTHETKLRIE